MNAALSAARASVNVPVTVLIAGLLLFATCLSQAMEIRPIGCRGANGKDVNTETLVFPPPGMAPSPCGALSAQTLVPVDCRETRTYLIEHAGNQPVHEVITRRAYRAARGKPISAPNYSSPWIAGVLWNDDPEWLLRKMLFNNGFRKLQRYAEVIAHGERHPSSSRLTIRSHFGDMQFLHAMKGPDDDDDRFHRKLDAWVSTMHLLAIGQLSSRASLASTGLSQHLGPVECLFKVGGQCRLLRDLFDQDGTKFLAHYPEKEGEIFMRNMAVGTILHILQDAHSRSHMHKVVLADGTLRRTPLTFDDANRASHCAHDMATTDTRGDIEAATVFSERYLRLWKRQAAVDEVRALFREIGLPIQGPADALSTGSGR